MPHWLDADPDELAAQMRELGEPAFRAKQLADWLHGKRVAAWEGMPNLPAELRKKLAAKGSLRRLRELERRDSADGLTHKWLFEAEDTTEPGKQIPRGNPGNPWLESVLIIEKQRRRRTACVSSMIGCPLACLFCATGRIGFSRLLTAGEILEQAYTLDAWSRVHAGGGLSHVVFMGMGEPLLNLPAVLGALRRLNDPAGLALSGRHLTVSTVGIPEGIRALSESGVVHRLAVSLHAPNQRVRERIMPAAQRWPLAELLAALEKYAETAARDLTFEYCLIEGVNAGVKEARELAEILRPFRCLVNLIPFNPVAGTPFGPPGARAVRNFQDELEKAGVAATLRTEKGAEIGAACGQLRAEREGIVSPHAAPTPG